MTDEKRLLPTVIYAVVCCDDGFFLRATDGLRNCPSDGSGFCHLHPALAHLIGGKDPADET
jgi:hypothetical protein